MTSTPTSSTQELAAHSPRTSQIASSQRLKKREYDRKAQRVAREKTKNRISQLESLVEKLSHQDSNATTASLMAQLSRVTEQRNKLMRCVRTTSSMFNDHCKEAETWDLSDSKGGAPLQPQGISVNMVSEKVSSPGSFATPITSCRPIQESLVENNTETQKANNMDALMDGNSFDIDQLLDDVMLQPGFTAGTVTPSMGINGPQVSPVSLAASAERQETRAEAQGSPSKCHCSSTTKIRRLSDGSKVSCNNWKAGNEILKEPFTLTNAILSLENETSEDIPVHAVLHGWDSLAHSCRMTPLWRKVRQLDELCFSACGQTERLAVLFIIHLLMRAYADPNSVKSAVIPQWYLKSPLQEISHDPSADYFAWPAVRYRFAVAPHRYCDNVFWHMFKEHFRIVWPYDFRDCYVRNVRLEAYGLSPLFKEKIRDLGSWTMEPDFFKQFPELSPHIPKFPGQLSPAPTYQFLYNYDSIMSSSMDMFLAGVNICPKAAKYDSEENPSRSSIGKSIEQHTVPTNSRVRGLFLSELGFDGDLDCLDF